MSNEQEKTNTPKKVSFDGGITYFTFEDIPADILAELEFPIHWGQVTYYMDAETAEKVNAELAPCSAAVFLKRYLELASEDLTAVYVAGLY